MTKPDSSILLEAGTGPPKSEAGLLLSLPRSYLQYFTYPKLKMTPNYQNFISRG
jgi:hypothetical protein